MAKYFIMVGVPGSGKSTKAKEIAKEYNAYINSSDSIREELYGDENILGDSKEVFSLMNKRTIEKLSNGENVICDATNVSIKTRRVALEVVKDIECEKIVVFMNTPYKESMKRNFSRERKVPAYVIGRMNKQLEIPTKEEGFDDIWIF